MPWKSKALWFDNPKKARLKSTTLNNPDENTCIIKTIYSGISPGTEKLVFFGNVPEQVHDSMKCPYMGGDFSYPIKYGYSLVGNVIEGPPNLVGKSVHVLHPHQNIISVDQSDVTIIPSSVPLDRATLISNMETAVNAIWDSAISIGYRILIIGFGIIGSLIARLTSRIPGTEVIVYDINPKKREFAHSIGFSVTNKPEKNYFDVAFNASTSGSGLQVAINSVDFEGRVIELSWYGDRSVNLQLGSSFHVMRKQIISSQVSTLSSNQRSRFTRDRLHELILQYLEDEAYDEHITDTLEFQDLPQLFHSFIEEPQTKGLSYLVKYDHN